MIQENEIRIGNWFDHDGTWSYRKDAKSPYPFKWDGSDWYAIGECTLFLENVSPIPLTPEIFRATAMKDTGHHNEFKIDIGGRDGELLVQANTGYYDISNPGNYGVSGKAEIKYLHQLQNLYFALTGEELPITL